MLKKASPHSEDIIRNSRSKDIDFFSTLLTSIKQPMTLAITSPWGSGKTTFIQLLREHLKADNYNSLYINAWENDYTSDPMTVIIVSLLEALNDSKSINISTSTKSFLKGVVKTLAPVILKASFDEIRENFKDSDGKLLSITTEASEKLLLQQLEAFTDFKNSLADMRKELLKATDNKSLFIFIDELDRCRPHYAISFLEHIKHFFNIDNIVFIIAIDKKQLNNDIKYLYGNEVNPDRYLRKMIDMELQLPPIKLKDFILLTSRNLGFEDMGENITSNNNWEHTYPQSIIESVTIMASLYKISLRDIEHLLSRLYVIYMTKIRFCKLSPSIAVTLVALKMFDEDFFNRIYNKKQKTREESEELENRILSLNLRDLDVNTAYMKPILGVILYVLYNNEVDVSSYINYRNIILVEVEIKRLISTINNEIPCVLESIELTSKYT